MVSDGSVRPCPLRSHCGYYLIPLSSIILSKNDSVKIEISIISPDSFDSSDSWCPHPLHSKIKNEDNNFTEDADGYK